MFWPQPTAGSTGKLIILIFFAFSCRNGEPQTAYQKLEAATQQPWRLPSAPLAPAQHAALQTTPLQRTYWLAGHNTYQSTDVETALQRGMQAVELDISDDGAPAADWQVCHTNWMGTCSGTVRGTLRSQLQRIQSHRQRHPGHPPIYLFVDKKNVWSTATAQRRPQHFDALLRQELGAAALFTPSELQAGGASPRWRIMHEGWPTPAALAGRVVVVLTSAELSVYGDNRTLRRYVHERRGAAMAFVAPSLRAGDSCTDTRTLQGDWESADEAGSPGSFVAIYNLRYSEALSLLPECHEQRFLSRVWFNKAAEARETGATFAALVQGLGANFVAVRDHQRPFSERWHAGAVNGVLPR